MRTGAPVPAARTSTRHRDTPRVRRGGRGRVDVDADLRCPGGRAPPWMMKPGTIRWNRCRENRRWQVDHGVAVAVPLRRATSTVNLPCEVTNSMRVRVGIERSAPGPGGIWISTSQDRPPTGPESAAAQPAASSPPRAQNGCEPHAATSSLPVGRALAPISSCRSSAAEASPWRSAFSPSRATGDRAMPRRDARPAGRACVATPTTRTKQAAIHRLE